MLKLPNHRKPCGCYTSDGCLQACDCFGCAWDDPCEALQPTSTRDAIEDFILYWWVWLHMYAPAWLWGAFYSLAGV